jgi:hypothetical protein
MKQGLKRAAKLALVIIAAGALAVAVPAQAAKKPAAKAPAKKPATKAPAKPATKAPAKPAPAPASKLPQESRHMLGTWVVLADGKENAAMRVVFREDGSFSFAGSNFASTGNFRLEEGTLRLVWASVDGTRVTPGTMKAAYALSEGKDSFVVDRYTYVKRGTVLATGPK